MTRSPGAMRAAATGSASTSSRTARAPISSCEGGRCPGVQTTRGAIRAERIGMAVAGHSSACWPRPASAADQFLRAAGLVSEPVKPILDTVVLSPGTGVYVSQSDKGEIVIGGGLDRIPSYAQRGNLPTLETVIAGVLEMFPIFGQLKLMRQWAGIVDVVPDSSPIIGPRPSKAVPQLRLGHGRLQGDSRRRHAAGEPAGDRQA